ncbi:MAG TPA: extracellular solute-binding protein [Bauldia sp.]|nr:extracellular solute-binding protein [Bauldia sp.]
MAKTGKDGGMISRRAVMKGMAVGAAAIAAPAIIPGGLRKARAEAGVIRMMGGPTVALQDWTLFEKETGLKMEFTPFHVDDVGALYNEILVNDAGDRFDLINTLAGVQRNLVTQGAVAQLDPSKLKNYAGIADTVKRSPVLYTGGDKDWSVPLYYNADSFGYFPEKLGLPRPPEKLTWDLLLNDERTKGQTALDGDFIALMIGGMYLKSRGLAEIGDPANMTPAECKTATDFLIERKKAGQFRSLWKTYDEQVANFMNGEVLVQRCWEPAVKEVKAKGLDVEYATCSDFHVNWMHATFIPTQAAARDNVDEIYRAIDWFIGGSYAAELAILRGYTGSRMDLGLAYAKENNWPADKIAQVEANIVKVETKFSNPNYWIGGAPDDLATHDAEMARFRNA